MGKRKRTASVLPAPVVNISSLTCREWRRPTKPYSLCILLASDNLLVCPVSPGLVVTQNEHVSYGVFYTGAKTIEKNGDVYACDVQGMLSSSLINEVQMSRTT
jgi:hypothetical protein